MDTKTKKRIHGFLKWVIGNTIWDYFRNGISIFLSSCATWWTSSQPRFSNWLAKMNMPLWIAIGAMFVGFLVAILIILAVLIWLTQLLLIYFTNLGNLVLSYQPLPNEIRFWVRNNDWRKKFKNIHISIQYIYIDPDWEPFPSPNSFSLGRFKQIELPSIKVDYQKHELFIPNIRSGVKFGPGSYKLSFRLVECHNNKDWPAVYYDMTISFDEMDQLKVFTFGRRGEQSWQ